MVNCEFYITTSLLHLKNRLSLRIDYSLLTIHQQYMQRCLDLAKRGIGSVAPNPMVGAVLVYQDKIIGEGYHQKYGEAHAEVNCIASVKEEDKNLIPQSTLYVSLEPCAHFGKTAPCADLIIQHKIPKVVIGCRDPFPEVDGKGIEKLKTGGVEVEVGIMENECKELNKRSFTFHMKKRPYIILKWAETSDKKIASGKEERLMISNEYSNSLVHQWRSEEAGILIGTNTALLDDPELTARFWEGKSPDRLVLDMNLRLPNQLKIFDKKVKTIIFNGVKGEEDGNLVYYKIRKDENIVQQLMNALYELKIQSVIVEGGAILIQSFIDKGMWDEARVIKNEELIINNACLPDRQGLDAPVLNDEELVSEQKLASDILKIYNNTVVKLSTQD